ncbi:MAG: methyltransferase [Gemmatimonadaceae bacterium]
MSYAEEVREWDQWIAETIGSGELVSVSVHSSDCRIYRKASNVIKARRLTPASLRARVNSLEDEFLILLALAPIPEAPKPVKYGRGSGWEYFEMTGLPPLRVSDPTFGYPKESLKDFIAVALLVFRMNCLGCSHGDLHRLNVGRNSNGTLSVFDFDQAVTGIPLRCWLRDFFGIGAYSRMGDISLFRRAAEVAWISVFVKGLRAIPVALTRPFRRPRSIADSTLLLARVNLMNSPQLDSLANAWIQAGESKASSPGTLSAYYSLDVSGVNFPGERPWVLRWTHIRRSVDFRGKRFLELGCNLGLLAAHAKLSGASFCLAVDIDADILSAARIAAKALGADVQFSQQNLDSSNQWEMDLNGYDIVSALSVMHWLKDKERAWRFLADQKEVLYEGHESGDEAVKRFRTLGFAHVSVLSVSERGRSLIYAAK